MVGGREGGREAASQETNERKKERSNIVARSIVYLQEKSTEKRDRDDGFVSPAARSGEPAVV